MPRFDITAQIELISPTNGREVIRDIERQLGRGVDVTVNMRGSRQGQRQMEDLRRSTQAASDAATNLGRSFTLATRRFAAFTVASRAVSLLTNNLARATDEAIDFERELVKIAQVTGKTVQELKDLTNEITRLSVGLGVSSKDLLGVSRILAQAGIQANDLKVAVQALAKTTLAPTFDDISKTAEGAVAILAQFGQGVNALESQLGSINAVAGQFAVESGDLIDAVRRFGGVFKSAGGELEELLALFTSIRATTRESAESIGTGLRTIFTRIQRPATIQFLKELGVNLVDTEGKFVGPFEAAKRLSEAFAELDQGDLKFVQIAEELGGFRQIGKVIPLLQQFSTAQEALKAAQEGQSSLTRDAVTAQQALSVQIQSTRENFLALIRELTDTGSFRTVTSSLLGIANAFIEITRALKPLLPLLTGLVAFRSIGFLGRFAAGARGALGAQTRNAGGRILGFNSGGFVPGSGNRDTVPAMLTPGEFVIKKSSAAKLGAGTLEAMNQNKFATGGVVSRMSRGQSAFGVAIFEKDDSSRRNSGVVKITPAEIYNKIKTKYPLPPEDIDKRTGAPKTTTKFSQTIKGGKRGKGGASYIRQGLDEKVNEQFSKTLDTSIVRSVNSAVKATAKTFGLSKKPKGIAKADQDAFLKGINTGTRGNLFEDVLTAIKGPPFTDDPNRNFDYEEGLGKTLGGIYSGIPQKLITDAKVSYAESEPAKIKKKPVNEILDEIQKSRQARLSLGLSRPTNIRQNNKPLPAGARRVKFATGGSVGGGDTVPALLTPGEFVVNKKSAQSIGYGNLARMNRDGVSRFAKGGAVGIQKFAGGGGVLAGAFNPSGIFALTAAAQVLASIFDQFAGTVDKTDQQLSKTRLGFNAVVGSLASLAVIGLAVKKGKEYFDSFGKGIQDSTASIREEAEARSSSSEGTGGDAGGDGASGGDTGTSKASNAQEQRLEKLANAEKKRIEVLKKADDQSKKVKDTESKLATQKDKVALANKKLQNTQETLGARQGQLNQITQKAINERRGLTAVEKKRADNLKAEITQLKSNESARKQTLNNERSIRRNIQKSLRDQNVELKKNNTSAAAAARGLKAVRTLRDQENSVIKRGGSIIKRSGAAFGRAFREQQRAASGSNRLVKAFNSVESARKGLSRGFAKLKQDITKLRTEAKKGVGAGGKIARGIGKAGSLATTGLGGALALGAIGSQIAGAVEQFAARAKELAIKQADTGKAIESAGAESVAKSVGEVFTLSGFFQAVSDPNKFAEKQAENFQRAQAEAGTQAAIGRSQADLERLKDGDFKLEDGSIDFGEATRGSAAAFSKARAEIQDITNPEERRKLEKQLTDQQKTQIAALIDQGAELSDLTGIIGATGGALGKNGDLLRKFAENLILARESAQQLAKANIDSLKITSAFNAANNAVSVFANTIAAGNDPLQGFFNTFTASKTNVGIDATAAITAIEDELVNAAQASGAGGLVSSIRGQAATARELNKFQATAGARITNADLRSGDAGKQDLEKALLEGVDDPQIRKAIRAKVQGLKDDEVATTDISKFVQEISNEVGQLSKGFEDSAKALLAHNQQMNQLYAQREALETKAAEAQIKAIDLQIEAAKIAEGAGGAKVSQEALNRARVAQFNAIGGLAGVSLGTGSAQDIGRVREQLAEQFFRQQNAQQVSIAGAAAGAVTTGVFAGPEGRQADLRPESIRAQQALITITKQQIAAKQEELKLIKEKNAAEKSALEKLISGDVEGFIQGQEAAGAAAALSTGNRGLASLFDSSALGAGFKELEKTGRATTAAAEATLSAFGIIGGGSARVLAGTTREEQAAQSDIRQLAGQLGGLAQDQAEFAQSEITIQDATIVASKLSFQRGLRETSENNLNVATGFAMGGAVYASRGMFVPRGTDTVPAMLTPGEFVVNRSAVNRGNNLQILRAMNSGGGASSPTAKSGGGSVGYYQFGGIVEAIGSAFSAAGSSLQGIFNQFNQSVEKLSTTKFSVQLDPVTINIQGDSVLMSMKKEIRDELLAEVGQQLQKGKINNTGSLGTSNSVLNKPIG